VDMTAFWAGPIIAHPLALLGADVIHVESAQRPDGIRMAMTVPMTQPGWWETSPYFNGTNTMKRGLTLDLAKQPGKDALLDLLAKSDVVIENYSPRVMPQLGLDYGHIRERRPDIVMLRAPAFGVTGPWADRVAYAPTIDEASGLSWVTGMPDDRPKIIGAASDAVGGMHGTIALLLALEHRRRSGSGMLIESPQIGPALNVAVEQVVEFSANGVVLGRVGNRSWTIAPQGVYRAADRQNKYAGVAPDDWIAISVEDDKQWRALCELVGSAALAPQWALAERRAQHDVIDTVLGAWCADRPAAALADQLAAAGVPAAAVLHPHELADAPPVQASGLYEWVEHPVAGRIRVTGYPLRSSSGPARWHRRPAPLLGEHNREILAGLLGRTDEEIAALAADGVIGTEVLVNRGW
jgi:crotonobetainyl-CoA:carnitine CoA-transferase CaiB-like acyl-CoA transferase